MKKFFKKLFKSKKKKDKLTPELARYIKNGIWQEQVKYVFNIRFISICFAFYLITGYLIGFMEYKSTNPHFLKEMARKLENICFFLLGGFVLNKSLSSKHNADNEINLNESREEK
jgi:hypothetical protein